MTLAGLGMAAARVALPIAAQYASTMFTGKQGEQMGDRNTKDAQDFREAARQLNVDPDVYAKVAAHYDGQARSNGQNMSRSDTAFANQLLQGNNRANSALNMAERDQQIAAEQAMDLSRGYRDAAANQAQTSANLMSSILSNTRR